MKTTILVLFVALVSCQKETETRYETLSLTKKIVIFTPVTQSSIITYSDTKKTQFLINRITSGNNSIIVMADTAGKIVYLAYGVNDLTGAVSEIVTPNIPTGAGSWASCMGKAIKSCASNPLCNAGTCRGEAIVGCVAAWGAACLFKKLPSSQALIKKLDKAKLIINLPPIKYV